MSSLRRRIFGVSSTSSSPSSSGTSTPVGDKNEDLAVVPTKQLDKLTEKVQKAKGVKRRHAWVFVLGGVFGVVLAALFANSQEMLDLKALADMNLDSILDVLPAGLVKDAQDLQKNERDAVNYDSFSVGLHARSEGVEAVHPVIMIPGVISTGLESWGTEEHSRQYFRKRLWGSWSMMRALFTDKPLWKRHIMLDKETGLDPPGIKLRAAQGFDAADFFITGYWIWNKILENLASIGYDPQNAFTAAYDWRLAYQHYETRDQYFTRLKHHIEMAARISNKKVVLLSHSMGSQVLFYFFHWVEAEGYGNGGSKWVDAFVDSWINISGCMLGALKGLPAVLSGEMRDTAQMNAFAVYGLEKFMSRHERAEIFRAMPGISSMLPIGGNAIWGDSTSAPDDRPGQNYTYGNFISFRQSNSSHSARNLTVDQALPYLFHNSDTWYSNLTKRSYSQGVAHTKEEVERNQAMPEKWINPLETRLPLAPNLKIFCFYGYGKRTERAYFYRDELDPTSLLNVTIDTALTEDDIDRGVVMGEGDGTVSLMSMGYMCHKGWKIKRYNPEGVKIKTVEMVHEPDRFNPRGGPNTGDHVDILGRSSLNGLILRVAGGKGDLVEESVTSNILDYVEKVKIYDDEDPRNQRLQTEEDLPKEP